MEFFPPIPDETPPTDFSELKIKSIRFRSELNLAEAANIAKATARYLGGSLTPKAAPFDFAWFLQLHREMFDDVWCWAGRLRRSETNLGIEPHLIEQCLYQLSHDLPCWTNESLLMRATLLHHRAVQIHPFENGNGRWARLLANIWLCLQAQNPTAWPAPDLSQESPIRGIYLEPIKAADQGEYSQLLALHQQFSGQAQKKP